MIRNKAVLSYHTRLSLEGNGIKAQHRTHNSQCSCRDSNPHIRNTQRSVNAWANHIGIKTETNGQSRADTRFIDICEHDAKQAIFAYGSNEARSRYQCCRRKAIRTKYYQCVTILALAEGTKCACAELYGHLWPV